jgi:hypothetical protein
MLLLSPAFTILTMLKAQLSKQSRWAMFIAKDENVGQVANLTLDNLLNCPTFSEQNNLDW